MKFLKLIPSYCLITLCALAFNSANAATYLINKDDSIITFTGTHADNPFTGTFNNWDAEIIFDEQALDQSSLNATFDLSSASTGNKMYDGTMPSKDWFNVKETPTATFKSTNITKKPDGSYTADGDLTLRGITNTTSFTFTLQAADQTTTHAKANISIPRLDYNIGKGSDPNADWVSKNISVQINISAQKQ